MIESIIDIPRKTLCQDIFLVDESGQLLPEVRKTILNLASEYSKWIKIEHVLLIGSILTKQWNEETDIDITLVGIPYSEESFLLAKQYAQINVEKNYILTHPVNFFVRNEWNNSYSEQVYDILDNQWVKQTEIPSIDIQTYMKDFENLVAKINIQTDKLDKDIIDYDKLIHFDKDELKSMKNEVKGKLEEIDKNVKKLVSFYKAIHELRKLAYVSDLTPEKLNKYKSKHALPAPVLYKLLEKSHYVKFLKTLIQILKDSEGSIDKQDEVEIVKNTMKNFIPVKSDVKIETLINELTGSSGAGAYEMPLGLASPGRYRKRFKKKRISGILTFK